MDIAHSFVRNGQLHGWYHLDAKTFTGFQGFIDAGNGIVVGNGYRPHPFIRGHGDQLGG
jgi:hypothetical protein